MPPSNIEDPFFCLFFIPSLSSKLGYAVGWLTWVCQVE